MDGDETPRTILRGLRRALRGDASRRSGSDAEEEIDHPAESDVLAGARKLAEELIRPSDAQDGVASTENTPRTTLRRLAEIAGGGRSPEMVGRVEEVSFLQRFEDRGIKQKQTDSEETPRTMLREFARVEGKRAREEGDERTLVIDRHVLKTPKTPDLGSPASFVSPFVSPMVSPELFVGSPSAPISAVSAPEITPSSQDRNEQPQPNPQSGLRSLVGHGRRGRGSRGSRGDGGGLRVGSIPMTLLKDLFRSHTSKRVASDSFAALHQIVAVFFDQVSVDLAAYAAHANRKTIESSDFECLMRRQRILKGPMLLSDAIRSHLPIDQSELLLPKANAKTKEQTGQTGQTRSKK
eukprot:TRINITY_DN80603_c0_g1_i1.p1 TRINITY_DN80603_c0_g1~~TRINITY_DN80603_c0_g1_i1.p1  ORF type:complete len:363 (+),score=85.27 TRINITY_DN80603_c0_g1_i1:36-1091(+)